MAGFYSCLKSNNNCIMAARPMDLIEPLEGEDVGEEFSRKKKSKFQSFKNFFAKKKKNREVPSPLGEAKLKPSQSSSDLSAPNLNSSVLHLPTEPGSKGSMGNKALSHDSVFIFESLPDVADKTCSQENLPGNVKALQLRLQENIQLGSPPLIITCKKPEDAGAISEDDGLPRSPPEISTLHDILTCSTNKSSNPVQRHSSLSLGGTDSEDDQVTSDSISRPLSPVSPSILGSPALPTGHSLPVDFNSPATPLGCLDTSAARHKMAVNPRKQKAFAYKTPSLLMEPLEKEQCSLRTGEGKSSHTKSLEGAGNQEKDWKGLTSQNANISSGSWTTDILPMTRVTDALRYSWNAGPGADGNWVLDLETQSHVKKETDMPLDSQPEDLTKEGMAEEGVKRTGHTTDDLKLNRHNSEEEVIETFASLQPEAETTGLCGSSFSAVHGDVTGLDHDLPAEPIPASHPQPVDQEAKDSRNGSDAKHCVSAEDSENSSLSPEPDSVSETDKAMVSTCENIPAVKEAEQTVNVEIQFFEVRTQLAASPELAIFNAKIEELPLQIAACEKLFFSTDLCHSPLSNSSGRQEANLSQKSGHLSSAVPRPAEIASKSSLLDNDAGDQSGSMEVVEESKASDEVVQTQTKSISAKPVRFTIAPAWQRSLSGGSGSVDSTCPRSSPSSPIKPELFEGIPQLDLDLPGCLFSSPERLDKGDRNTHSATEQPKEELQGRESPFGVKLRRTSSLLKYQTEKQRQEPPKKFPSSVSGPSSVFVKDEPKSPVSETPAPKIIGSTKAVLAKSGFQEEKTPLKAKPEEGMTKQLISKPSDQSPAAPLETPSSEPAWISMAKLKRRGFQGHPLAKGQKTDEDLITKAEQEEKKHACISQLEKLNLTGQNLLKSSSPYHLCALESKIQPKMTISATKVRPIRAASQEVHHVEKEVRTLPSLPLSSCSPAEPPWLSLAKKKAKAWSEMPQIVQ
ncbi:acrosomal protein KIAA1210 homolog isoform X2 [Sceloporus undulatus]|uniref:acrosomal protein KIAA1210 homolog isoform X2 n=1 Tax=Sceloporus undulatus TaxID=8520 RepID=UPI001C4D1958|nr:acrosomal protein KIAA1210 homolog isoform X2 [Sceloporus undulatus]